MYAARLSLSHHAQEFAHRSGLGWSRGPRSMVRASYVPDAGHFIRIDFHPRTGHEQAGWRPAIVLSPASYNRPTGLAIVVPNHESTERLSLRSRAAQGAESQRSCALRCDLARGLARARRSLYRRCSARCTGRSAGAIATVIGACRLIQICNSLHLRLVLIKFSAFA